MVAAVVGLFAVSIIRPGGTAQGTISYQLAWDLDGADVAADGSWSVTTDLGYVVTISDGALTTFSATLVSCPHFHGLFDRLLGLVALPVAWAGHSSAPDPALVGGPMEQSLVDETAVVLGSVTVHEPSYCEGFTNWGAGATPETVADGTARATLRVVGTWSEPGDAALHQLAIETTTAWGTKSGLLDATERAVYAELGDEPITIDIVRDPSTAFDGIDFATADDDAIATAVLRALAANTSFVVTTGSTHPA